MKKALATKIKTRRAKVSVIGLGYVGLPLAVSFARAGFQVVGVDKDEDRVERVMTRRNYIADIPASQMSQVVRSGKLSATTDFRVLSDMDVIIICVPTPIKRRYTPDVSYMTSAVKTLQKYLKKGALVVMESTTFPGTTRELIKPGLEKSGLKAGKDFFLSFSPERIDPGNKKYDVTRIPKVVGGLTGQCTQVTALLYHTIIKNVHCVSSPEAAEMTKLLENSFRIINIGWINEVAMMSHELGIDIWEVIGAAKTKPFGFMPFYPGLGVGGHCIPEDPLYLYWRAKKYGFNSKYIKLSADTNFHMAEYAVKRIAKLLSSRKKRLSSAKVLVLGVTYKKDVKDLRKSPALRLIALLQEKAKQVDYSDPLIPYLEIFNFPKRTSVALTPKAIKEYDCVVIATDHTSVDYGKVLANAKTIFDTRNVYPKTKSKKVERI